MMENKYLELFSSSIQPMWIASVHSVIDREAVLISSVSSLDAGPSPKITMNAHKDSKLYKLIDKMGKFVLHYVDEENYLEAAILMGYDKEQRFKHLTSSDLWREDGSFLTFPSSRSLQCKVHSLIEVEDKVIIVANVTNVESGKTSPSVVYENRKFKKL